MEYLVSDILTEVKVLLDRNNASPSLDIGEEDALSIDEIIESRILPAATYIALKAPLSLLDNSKPLTGSPVITNGVGVLSLPSDFLRLHDFGMRSWEGQVRFIDEADPLYAQQKSRYGGVRGNKQAPVVAIVNHGNQWELELYSCTASDQVRHGNYIAMPAKVNGRVDISQRLKDTVVYYIGYLTCLSMGDTDTAARLLEPVQAILVDS